MWLSSQQAPPNSSKVMQKIRLTDSDAEILDNMPVNTLLLAAWDNATEITGADVHHFLDENVKISLDDCDDQIDRKPNIMLDELLLNTTTTTATHTSTVNTLHNNATLTNHNGVVANAHHLPNNSLTVLKPLPPFEAYSGHLSINGISGHHYHTIAAAPNNGSRVLVETNNNSADATNHNHHHHNNVSYYSTDHVVSSSTMDSNPIDSIKSESAVLDISDDLMYAALMDPTVTDTSCAGENSSDSWLDIEAWINQTTHTSPTGASSGRAVIGSQDSGAIGTGHGANGPIVANVLCGADTLKDFVPTNSQYPVAPSPSHHTVVFHPQQLKAAAAHHQQQSQTAPPPSVVVTQQSQSAHHHSHSQQQQREINTTFPHMPLLQNRLQNGPPKVADVQELGYNIVSECPSPSSSTPYLAQHSPPCHVVSTSDIGFMQVHSTKRPSPELQGSYAHTTTPTKKSRSRAKSKMAPNIVYSEGNLGKEKTVHRCHVCNRGFLNKSNIKVHLRTHTGEKPFRCEVCGKAFRQKAHLIKHAQIHKRVGRD